MVIYVTTDTELGWDCVTGTFSSEFELLDYMSKRYGRVFTSISDLRKYDRNVHVFEHALDAKWED